MANTAQVNQPLSSHPLPFGVGNLLGAGSTLVKGVAPNTDALLVPPPAANPNGVVARGLDTVAVLINNTATGVLAGANNFSLVYKAEGVLEAVFGVDGSALAASGLMGLSTSQFLLAPTDRGIFLRLGDLQENPGPVDFTGTLDSYMSYFDFRELNRVAVDLTTDYQTILSGAQGKSRLLSRGGGDFSELFAAVANFDSIVHTIEARLTDGVNTIQLPGVAATPIDIGTLSDLVIDALANLQEGWALQARTTVASALRPCRLLMSYTDTNLSPVRTNQGGAY